MLGSLYTGHWHEAIAVGAAAALRPDDYLAPIHRDLGAHLWRGMEPWQVMASFLGKATSPTGGRDGTLHYGRLDLNVYNLPSHIPANFPVATGRAFAFKYRGEDGVAWRSAATGRPRGRLPRGGQHRRRAGPAVHLHRREQPVRLLHPLRLQPRADFAAKAVGVRHPGEKVDGTDVVAVYEAVPRRVARARAGEGPSLIEAVTMRMHGHAEHDPADYVPRKCSRSGRRRTRSSCSRTRSRLGVIDDEGTRRSGDRSGR